MVKVVEAKIIELPKSIYNTLRSFVESSLKEKYPWNVGVRLENIVKFIKSGKWQLEINVENNNVALLDRQGRPIVIYERPKLTVYFNDFDINNYTDLLVTHFYADVPYAEPIQLAEIYSRLVYYIVAVEDYLKSLKTQTQTN